MLGSILVEKEGNTALAYRRAVEKKLRARVKALEEDKTFLGDRIRELEIANSELRKSLAFEQQVHFETKKRLPPFQRKWWQFWRK